MRPDRDGCWFLPDSHAHMLSALLGQGWKEWSPPKFAPVYRDELHQEVVGRPMPLAEIFLMCHAQNVELRVSQGKLMVRTPCGITARLMAHLKHQKATIRAELERRAGCGWEVVS